MISRSIVFDTNVLVSAALKENSNPATILQKLILKEIVAITCPTIVEEYREVLARPKFRKWKFPPMWFEVFLSQSIFIKRDPPLWPLSGPDSDDLVFLSLAHYQGATLVTGNLKDYPENIRKGTAVTNPDGYLSWLFRV